MLRPVRPEKHDAAWWHADTTATPTLSLSPPSFALAMSRWRFLRHAVFTVAVMTYKPSEPLCPSGSSVPPPPCRPPTPLATSPSSVRTGASMSSTPSSLVQLPHQRHPGGPRRHAPLRALPPRGAPPRPRLPLCADPVRGVGGGQPRAHMVCVVPVPAQPTGGPVCHRVMPDLANGCASTARRTRAHHRCDLRPVVHVPARPNSRRLVVSGLIITPDTS